MTPQLLVGFSQFNSLYDAIDDGNIFERKFCVLAGRYSIVYFISCKYANLISKLSPQFVSLVSKTGENLKEAIMHNIKNYDTNNFCLLLCWF